MPIVSGGGGGGGGPAAGTYVPVGGAGGTLDTTTYDNTITGSGKLRTLVFPAETVAFAIALAGDAFPRWLFTANPEANGIYMYNGSADASVNGCELYDHNGEMRLGSPSNISMQTTLIVQAAQNTNQAPQLQQLSPKFGITAGALPTQVLVSGAGAQVNTDADVETHTPVTFNPGVATTATCTVALSPNNVTYSTLAVVTKPVGTVFDGEIDDITVRVPAGWYIKLTVVNATLGTTTYY